MSPPPAKKKKEILVLKLETNFRLQILLSLVNVLRIMLPPMVGLGGRMLPPDVGSYLGG